MENLGKLILRLSVGGLMLFHGVQKLLSGIGGVKFLIVKAGLPEMLSYGVYLGELIAPVFLLLGIYTRVSGLIIALTMLVSIPAAYPDGIFHLNEYGGLAIELNAMYLFGGLAVMFLGSGKYKLIKQNGFWKE
ncbi:DoxX family protein [Labilibaculum sp.]|uniref:DoxX family protein n=1 Tax=Labilibaculum sp. TaxID=2060723 RepID=UPI002AA7D7D3|nr:DoxX family protein [Labilibaculum sp.]MBN2598199.1 DoxX family protein [Marinifilaceae bacterium]